MSKQPFTFQFPKLFKRIKSQQNPLAKHWIALREKKQYRNEHKAVLVQGYKTIKELRDQHVALKSLVVTAKEGVYDASEIKEPAGAILRQPQIFPAESYYLTDIDLTRRILGTSSKPGNHELFAEVPFPTIPTPPPQLEKWLVLDRINDPGNMGTLIRTARALGWQAGLISSSSCDLYNDKVIRASRALSLTWPHQVIPSHELVGYLKEQGITPIVADMMPTCEDGVETWSVDDGNSSDMSNKKEDGDDDDRLKFWWVNERRTSNSSNITGSSIGSSSSSSSSSSSNSDKQQQQQQQQEKGFILPKRIALVLSSEHGGVKGLDNELRVSIPMNSQVESLNVAIAGAILMSELNRLLKIKK